MIEVELPDGTIAEFPDGTSKDLIKGALQKKFGAPSPAAAPPTPPPVEDKGWLRTIDDGVRGAADMATFGFADEIAAKMGSLTGIGGASGEYDQNLAEQRQRDSEGGGARLTGQLAGAVAMPGTAAKTVLGAVGMGAAQGAAYGFGSGEGGAAERLANAILGAVTGGAAGGVVRGVGNAISTIMARTTIPDNAAIKAAGSAAYKAADDAGVIIKPQSTQRLAQAIKNDLAEFGYDAALQPGVGAVLNRLDAVGDQNLTLKGLDVIRKVASNAGSGFDNPSQKALSSKIIDHIDRFVTDLKYDDVLAGNTKEAGNAILKARSAWTKLKKSEMLDTAVLKAERRAASTGSGGNADNALRQNVRRLLDNPKTARGMSKAEKEAADRVVRGTTSQNAMRLVGKLAPTGVVSGGLGTSMGASLGSVVGGPAGAAVGATALPMIGAASKALADRATVRNVEKLSEIVRSGGLTAQDISRLMQEGKLPSEIGFQVLNRLGMSAQAPAARMGALAGEAVQR